MPILNLSLMRLGHKNLTPTGYQYILNVLIIAELLKTCGRHKDTLYDVSFDNRLYIAIDMIHLLAHQ